MALTDKELSMLPADDRQQYLDEVRTQDINDELDEYYMFGDDEEKKKSPISDLLGNVPDYIKKYLQAERETTPQIREQLDKNVGLHELPYNIYKDISQISPEDLQLNLERYSALDMPEAQLEAAQNLGPSAFENMQMDPRLRQQQEDSLAIYKKLGDTGFTPEMLAAANKARRSNMSDYMSNVSGAEQRLAQRGMSGPATSAAMAIAANQQMANKQQEQEEALNAMAFKNKLEALAQGQRATQSLLESDLSAQANKAQGLDRLATTQASLRADAASRNAAAINSANLVQARNQQNIANQNVDISNEQQKHNVVGSRKDVADMRAKAAAGLANTAGQVAQAGGNRTAVQSASSSPLQGVGQELIKNVGKQVVDEFGNDFVKNIFSSIL